MKFASLVALVLSVGTAPSLSAQKQDSLYQNIARLDSIIFDAYNHCALTTMAPYFAPDLEFYHDQSGLSRGREAMLRDVKKYVAERHAGISLRERWPYIRSRDLVRFRLGATCSVTRRNSPDVKKEQAGSPSLCTCGSFQRVSGGSPGSSATIM
jgi:hypothetical protein